jgi:hypothetical protein
MKGKIQKREGSLPSSSITSSSTQSIEEYHRKHEETFKRYGTSFLHMCHINTILTLVVSFDRTRAL